MDLPYDALGVLQSTGIEFIETARSSDHGATVPSCPEWSIGDLIEHQADTWYFWARIVADRVVDRSALKTIQAPTGLDGDLLLDWLATTHNSLFSALTRAPLDQQVWSWTGANRDAGWVRRRMVHESAVHLWDLQHAIGAPSDIPTSIAADGIDEFLMWFMGRSRGEGELKVGGTVHLHCTDTDESDTAGGEWFVSSVKEPSCTFTREHRKGDAAVRGPAHDLLLWLWRRNGERPDAVEVIGDEVVARRFRAYTDLAW